MYISELSRCHAYCCSGAHFMNKFSIVIQIWWKIHSASINSLRPRQNGRLFADDTFKCIFLNENIRISNKISPKFVPKGLINNIPAFVLIMAWRRPGNKPLSEPMLVRSLTHICITRPQWVKDAVEESLWNFAHSTAAVLLWNVRNFVVIWYPTVESHYSQFSIEFELQWKNRSWNLPLASDGAKSSAVMIFIILDTEYMYLAYLSNLFILP